MRFALFVIPLALAGVARGAEMANALKPITPEIADQNRRSEALNAEVHNRLRAVDGRNAATKAAYEKALRDYRVQLAQHDADAAKAQAEYAKATDAWKAAVAACKAGDKTKCAAPDSKAAQP